MGSGFAEHLHRRFFTKNLSLLYGAWLMTLNKWKTLRKTIPAYEELHNANASAWEGDIPTARIIYFKILTAFPGHPGIHLNYGLAYLKQGKQNDAIRNFEKALAHCMNYQPVIEQLERLKYKKPAEAIGTDEAN